MFLEKSYRGNNKWYFYILTLIIVFAAVQVTSIPLAVYSIIMHPEMLSGGTNNLLAVTNTNLGLALLLFTFAGGCRPPIMREISSSQKNNGHTHGQRSL